MAEKKEIVKPKPPEILELEREYGIELEEIKEKSPKQWRPTNIFYELSAEESIISLTLGFADIQNLVPIQKLQKLERLNLGYNRIEDISPLAELKKLKKLTLYGNNIKNIKPLQQLQLLQFLELSENLIKDFSPLENLTHLTFLSLNRTGLSNLAFVQKLIHLETLWLAGNSIEDIHPLQCLGELKDITLGSNNIVDISPLAGLNHLESVTLPNNQVKELPKKLAEKFFWPGTYGRRFFTIGNNPLEFPPYSVLELGGETVKTYYETSEQFGHQPLSEGRIIFVGDGASGKTSLIERVLYNRFEHDRPQTNGIKIEHLHLQHPGDGRDLVFHIWDFGGQEIQHAVHKFFFTEGCLYVLVLDNRREEEPEYWLQQVESLGGRAPVLVVFNKQDENITEIADRKYLKEKYPNIVGFFNTSCKSGFGLDDFKKALESEAVRLRTVNEQFPVNWLSIKKAIQDRTSGTQHYLDFDSYREICRQNQVDSEAIQKLLLRYFTTIGVVTWFGDTYLTFLHVLSPAWITEGVYKIITADKTARLRGQIEIGDFKELLQPLSDRDYSYDEKHYGYILSMMKKFDLCYTPDDKTILIPSAFGKEPRVEYRDFRGDEVRTYILQFMDYMPMALIHRFIAKNLKNVYEANYWYSGIVIRDSKSDSLTMVHADKEAKRIYIRIKGDAQLEIWAHIRREFAGIASSYANIRYEERVVLDESDDNTVSYEDLTSYLTSGKDSYFHPKLKRDFQIRQLLGMFEPKEATIDKVKNGEIAISERDPEHPVKILPFIVNILNNNSPTISNTVNIDVDIDIQMITKISNDIKGEASYLLEELHENQAELREALEKIMQFADAAKAAQNTGDIKAGGWGRKLKNVLEVLSKNGEALKNIRDGSDALHSMVIHIANLAHQVNLTEIGDLVHKLFLK